MSDQTELLPTLPCDGAVFIGQRGAHVVGVWTTATRAQHDVAEIAARQGQPITAYSVHLVPFFGQREEIRP